MSSHANVAAAFVAAQAQFTHVIAAKEGQARAAKFKYASMADLVELARPILAAHQLAFVSRNASFEGGVRVVTRILHASGEFMEDEGTCVPIPADAGAQVVGSGYTYARRYGLLAMLGIAADDDDGAAAMQAQERKVAAAAALAAVPKVTAEQAEIIARLAAHARPTLDIAVKTADALVLTADQYEATIGTVLGACVKAKRMTQDDADNLLEQIKGDALTPAQVAEVLVDVEAGVAA